LSSNPPHGAYTRAARSRYVAFDILYVKEAGKEATSTIHLTLGERKEILRKAVQCLPEGRSSIPLGPAEVMRGRIMPLWPGPGPEGQFCELVTGDAVARVKAKMDAAIEMKEEGIVCKQLSSQWEPGARNDKCVLCLLRRRLPARVVLTCEPFSAWACACVVGHIHISAWQCFF
jgi:hypothetical protein